MILRSLLFLTIISGCCNIIFAHEEETNGNVGFEEKAGAFIPLDIPFVDETGAGVKLGDVVRGPTILSFVYYKCPNACDFLLSGMAGALRPFTDKPGSEPNLVTITIDDRETISDALRSKKIAFESIQKPYPEDKWHFLTGSAQSIREATDAAGFRYARQGDEFDHPIGIIIISPKGKIVRYIIGTEILPMDLAISLMEASSGTVSPTVARVIRFCFSYNPKSHQYVFNILQVSGTTIFAIIGCFALYLAVSGRKKRKAEVK